MIYRPGDIGRSRIGKAGGQLQVRDVVTQRTQIGQNGTFVDEAAGASVHVTGNGENGVQTMCHRDICSGA